jgi:dTDP-4-dehydrorhamnose 3,5-epimerase
MLREVKEMIVEETKLPEVWLIKPDVHQDYRGDYAMTYNKRLYTELTGVGKDFIEHDISTSMKGVLRGIHYSPNCWKLNECLYGKIYYVVVNCDENDKDFGKWQSFILSGENHFQLLKHPRYGSGFVSLSELSVFHYLQSEYYVEGNPNQRTFRWDSFGIEWPDLDPIMSKRDRDGAYEWEKTLVAR